MPHPHSFFSELKRRNVVRVAAVYAATAFVVLQAADLLAQGLRLPDWVFPAVTVFAILGFPLALVLAWAFELTPEGIKRTQTLPGAPGSVELRQRWTLVGAGVGLALLVGVGLAAWHLRPDSGTRSGAVPDGTLDRSIAVLPFDNLSAEPGSEYFSDGITEDVLTQLSRIPELKVISRQSVMRYKQSDKPMRQIAQELGTAYVVEGSVRRAGGQVRIAAQLIDASTDRHLWAESYDRELTTEAIFQIQSEIAGHIARALQARLSPEQQGRLAAAPTQDLTAYDYYLQGRGYAQRGTREDLLRATAFYRQAIAQDSRYALAYAALAHAFAALEGSAGAGAHWLDSAQIAAQKSVELAPGAAEGYSALALVHWNRGRLDEALDTYRRALALRPNDPDALWGMAFAQWLRGALDEALRLAQRAAVLDPATPGNAAMLGRVYMALGDRPAAERWFRRALQLQPDFPWAHEDLVALYIWQGDHAKAAEQLRTLGALLPDSPEYLQGAGLLALRQGDHARAARFYEHLLRNQPDYGFFDFDELGFAYARLGNLAQARQVWRRGVTHAEAVHQRSGQLFWNARDLGRIAAANGDPDAAIRWLETAYRSGWRGWPTLDIAADPLLESLRTDRRFQQLRARILADLARMRAAAEQPAGATSGPG